MIRAPSARSPRPRWRYTLIATATSLVALVSSTGCGSDSTSASGPASPKYTTLYCAGLGELQPLLQGIKDGTKTDAEIVAEATTAQGKLDEAAIIADSDDHDATATANLRRSATAVGHLKVAASDGDESGKRAAYSELSTAIAPLPTCAP